MFHTGYNLCAIRVSMTMMQKRISYFLGILKVHDFRVTPFMNRKEIRRSYTLKKTRLEIIQFEKTRLIKVSELKLTQVELF